MKLVRVKVKKKVLDEQTETINGYSFRITPERPNTLFGGIKFETKSKVETNGFETAYYILRPTESHGGHLYISTYYKPFYAREFFGPWFGTHSSTQLGFTKRAHKFEPYIVRFFNEHEKEIAKMFSILQKLNKRYSEK